MSNRGREKPYIRYQAQVSCRVTREVRNTNKTVTAQKRTTRVFFVFSFSRSSFFRRVVTFFSRIVSFFVALLVFSLHC